MNEHLAEWYLVVGCCYTGAAAIGNWANLSEWGWAGRTGFAAVCVLLWPLLGLIDVGVWSYLGYLKARGLIANREARRLLVEHERLEEENWRLRREIGQIQESQLFGLVAELRECILSREEESGIVRDIMMGFDSEKIVEPGEHVVENVAKYGMKVHRMWIPDDVMAKLNITGISINDEPVPEEGEVPLAFKAEDKVSIKLKVDQPTRILVCLIGSPEAEVARE